MDAAEVIAGLFAEVFECDCGFDFDLGLDLDFVDLAISALPWTQQCGILVLRPVHKFRVADEVHELAAGR